MTAPPLRSQLDQILRAVPRAMLRDRHRLRSRARSLRDDLEGNSGRNRQRRGRNQNRGPDQGKPPSTPNSSHKPDLEGIARRIVKLEEELTRSIRTADHRRDSLPKPKFDAELPVCERREEIAKAIHDNQVVVICGETGSGKSTQLPKICLDLGRGVYGTIGHTQPRRIAARSVAARVAEELGSTLGQTVGYKVRFSDETGPNTYIKLMTDGILLAESQGDRFFEQYDTIIIDEAHERSLNIDFLLGMLKRLLPKRPDLKVIITSATIDAERFARHFGTEGSPAPVIEVSGRTYPIEMRWRPVGDDEEPDDSNSRSDKPSDKPGRERNVPVRGISDPDWQRAVVKAVDELAQIDTGDILIFMPTERDIHETVKALRKHRLPGDHPGRETELMPLYARLPGNQQQKVFAAHPHRRIVIATNVAESSLTVPGIRYVIDPGTARISRYSTRSKTQRLPIERISRASADQRAGRCGRIASGVCIRLFSEDDYNSRDQYTTPEIQRTNLASVILQTKAFQLGDVERFPFMEPPQPSAIRDGYKTLFELGAIDSNRDLTELGRRLGRLPVDPRIGRMVLAADEEDCVTELLIIAAILEIQDPRERPLEHQADADAAHAQFMDPDSDFLAYLKLWDFYHELREKLSRGQLRKACRQNFLSYNRMREWADIHRQLHQLARESGMKIKKRRDESEPIHRAILAGLLSNIALRGGETREYSVGGGGKAFLWPGSGLLKAPQEQDDEANEPEHPSEDKRKRQRKNKSKIRTAPRWLVSAELIETSNRFMRTSGRISPEWIEPLAQHLIHKRHIDPHWSRSQGSVMADERVTLYGLTIIPRRPVRYGPIDPKTSREIFLLNGLVEGDIDCELDFYMHNQALFEDLESAQAKLRKYDFLFGDQVRYEFYDQRIPNDVYDLVTLRKWWKKEKQRNGRLLFMQASDLASGELGGSWRDEFPDMIATGTHEAPLDYRFEPGEVDDGITITIPIQGLNQLDSRRIGWLVPGLLEEKVVAMIRSLPKPLRRQLGPAPDAAKKAVPALNFGDGAIETSLGTVLSQLAGTHISPGDFQMEKVPEPLKMKVRVLDAEGDQLADGRDLETLRHELGAESSDSFASIDDPRWTRDDITEWDFGELPAEIDIQRGGMELKAHPMLVDRVDSVSIRLSDSLEKAAVQSRRGLMRLFMFTAKRDLRTQVAWLPNVDRLMLLSRTLPEFELRSCVTELIADRAIGGERRIPRTKDEFDQCVEKGRRNIPGAVQDVARIIPSLLETHHEAVMAGERLSSRFAYAADDIRGQLARLTEPGFLITTPWNWLTHYPRYFRAVAERVDSLNSGAGDRDREASHQVGLFWDRYAARFAEHEQFGLFDPALDQFRWILEEYRVSLFAQKLGTSIKISDVRLEKQWDKVKA